MSEAEVPPKPPFPNRTKVILLAFVLSRVVVILLALNPDSYAHGPDLAADRDLLYRSWSSQVLDHGSVPYSETPIEYPPGAIPFLILPGVFGTGVVTYRLAFVLMMAVIDLAGLVACLRIAKRWAAPRAAWLWIVLVGLMGPLAYARFDLVPAVMTAWAIEAMVRERWGRAAGWIAAGGVAKIYPFLLLPLLLVSTPRRRRVVLASVAVLLVGLLPFITVLGDVWQDVGSYHLTRGIHVESLAGSLLFIASRQGLASPLQFGSGALHFTGNVAEELRFVCDALVLLAMAVGIYISAKLPRGDVRNLAATMLGTLCLAMVASPVLSPQFMLWIIPLGVAVYAGQAGRPIPFLLLGITLATMAIFPFLYTELTFAEPLPLILLWGRNLALLGLGILVLRPPWRSIRQAGPSVKD
ncbi:MAG: glycosyltransferase 87 family protein [Actinomycetota bacterium]